MPFLKTGDECVQYERCLGLAPAYPSGQSSERGEQRLPAMSLRKGAFQRGRAFFIRDGSGQEGEPIARRVAVGILGGIGEVS